MLSLDGFNEMVKAIMALGYPQDKAADYAARIGDTPEEDENGLAVIRDDAGNVIDRLAIPREDGDEEDLTVSEMQKVADEYEEKFGNLDDVAHPSVMMDRRFIEMLEEAVKVDKKLTRQEIEKVFGCVAWEW